MDMLQVGLPSELIELIIAQVLRCTHQTSIKEYTTFKQFARDVQSMMCVHHSWRAALAEIVSTRIKRRIEDMLPPPKGLFVDMDATYAGIRRSLRVLYNNSAWISPHSELVSSIEIAFKFSYVKHVCTEEATGVVHVSYHSGATIELLSVDAVSPQLGLDEPYKTILFLISGEPMSVVANTHALLGKGASGQLTSSTLRT